ncbi:uncharacterized protein LOC106011435 [Aplysia californica]|uniref:Uncharacterized protein LOC106011435 n=1 Tax=Aplysia californica TaxID=6500 RepID=A0ABM0ZXI9_APLCA|nr:uncharacterized protein LOC106011435 [Aplysia californica]
MSSPKQKHGTPPELQVALRARAHEKLLNNQWEEEARRSARTRRQIDHQMLMARQDLLDIKARTPSPHRRVPDIAVHGAGGRPISRYSSEGSLHLTSENLGDAEVDLLGPKTKRNLELSKKLVHSLEVTNHKQGSSPPGKRSSSNNRQVSPRALEELERASRVLRHTPHEAMVEHLLASVTSAPSSAKS